MKILVIDDDPDIRRVTGLALSRVGGMDVVLAGSGPEGVASAQAESPDGILLDVTMPEMDGPQTLAALRANPATAPIPVVFLTARDSPVEVERLRGLGASGVLRKPFDPMSLARSVREILGER
jgi:CheY-like chemotaxis protein